MGTRANPRLIKTARSYTIEEAAQTLSAAVVTVRGWEKDGLRVLKSQRPFIIMGQDLRAFLEARQAKHKRPLGTGEFYCMACKTPKTPYGAMADYVRDTPTTGRLIGLCPCCGREMHRFVSPAKLPTFAAKLAIEYRDAGDA